MVTFTGRSGKHDRLGSTGSEAETDAQKKVASERRQRSFYLASSQGSIDLQKALGQITQPGKDDRLEGADSLKRLKSGKSFAPLLEAAEKEQDTEVKLQLLKALCSTVKDGDFAKPPDLVERLEKLILAETDMGIARQAAIALYLHGPYDRSNGFAYMSGLRDRAEEAHGKEHPVPRGISAAISHLLDSNEL